jgi:hypothetical protein
MRYLRFMGSLRRFRPALFGAVALCASAGARPLATDPDSLFAHLKPTHPRMILSDSLIQRIKADMAARPSLLPVVMDMRKKCDSLLSVPVCAYSLVGGSLLQVSRTLLERIYFLAFMAHYDANKNYADRAGQELLAASSRRPLRPPPLNTTAGDSG